MLHSDALKWRGLQQAIFPHHIAGVEPGPRRSCTIIHALPKAIIITPPPTTHASGTADRPTPCQALHTLSSAASTYYTPGKQRTAVELTSSTIVPATLALQDGFVAGPGNVACPTSCSRCNTTPNSRLGRIEVRAAALPILWCICSGRALVLWVPSLRGGKGCCCCFGGASC